MITRTEPITLMASGAFSIYSKIKPLYAASNKITLQELLQGCDLPFLASSLIYGETDKGVTETLEDFIIQSNMPQTYIKSIGISFGNRPIIHLKVKTLYVKRDTLYMDVIEGGRECRREGGQLITNADYPIGLDDYQVSNISRLELEGGLHWKQ
jgi:hypothetical protein